MKSAAEDELVDAVRAAAAGGTYLTPALGARLARVPQRPRLVADGGDEEPEVGSTFAGHRIDGVAGRGAMGVVFRATDLVARPPRRAEADRGAARRATRCSARASSASAASPPGSTTPTWCRSSTPARSAASST